MDVGKHDWTDPRATGAIFGVDGMFVKCGFVNHGSAGRFGTSFGVDGMFVTCGFVNHRAAGVFGKVFRGFLYHEAAGVFGTTTGAAIGRGFVFARQGAVARASANDCLPDSVSTPCPWGH